MPVKQRILIAWAIAAMNAVGFVGWINVNKLVAFLALAVFIVAAAYPIFVRCKNCGFPVLKKKRTIAGLEISYWGPAFPITVDRAVKNCS
jgi:hypothetical protein